MKRTQYTKDMVDDIYDVVRHWRTTEHLPWDGCQQRLHTIVNELIEYMKNEEISETETTDPREADRVVT